MDIRSVSVKDILWELASVMLGDNGNRHGDDDIDIDEDVDGDDMRSGRGVEQRQPKNAVSEAVVDRLFRMLRPAQQVG